MLSIDKAKKVILKNIPNGKIKKCVVYKNLFVFQVFTDDLLEGNYDPFYSVDRNTAKFDGFKLFEPGVFDEVMDLFENPDSII